MNTLISTYTENSGKLFQTCSDHRTSNACNPSGTFAQALSRQGTGGAGGESGLSPRQMTMEQYKAYIDQKIKQIPVHPSRRNEMISVTISDEGYEAMKNDPEYEAWVLNDLRLEWSQPGFYFGGSVRSYTTVCYGATKEECRKNIWNVPCRSASDRARQRQEENRRRLAKKIKKQRLQKHLREIAFQHQEQQRKLVKKLIEHRQEIEKENRQRWRRAVVKDKPDGTRVLEITDKKKSIEKITERDILRMEEVLLALEQQREFIEQRFYEDGNFYGFHHWLLNG